MDHILAAFFGIAQQLLEEERIAGGALDARQRQALARIDEPAGKSQRIREWQRAETDRGDGDRARQAARHRRQLDRLRRERSSPGSLRPRPSRIDSRFVPENLWIGPCRSSTMIRVGPLRSNQHPQWKSILGSRKIFDGGAQPDSTPTPAIGGHFSLDLTRV